LLVAIVAAALALGAAGGVVIAGHSAAQLPAEMDVVLEHVEEGERGPNITALVVEVDYHGDEPVTVTPHVWSSRQHVQHAWKPYNLTLQPGTNMIEFRSPNPHAPIRDDKAQLWLADGQRRATLNWITTLAEGS
jgi:hypothetical protein